MMLSEELVSCPHCGKPVEFINTRGGYAIICSDHSCLGRMEIHYGWMDNREIFKKKLIANWNRRQPEIRAVDAAVNCILKYRKELYDSCQEPYDEHGQCCIDVADEIINRLRCFTVQDAVDAWTDQNTEKREKTE